MKHVWKVQITYSRYSSESVFNVNVVAKSVEVALERAYVAAYIENRWTRSNMNAKLLERLDLKVFV